MDRSIFQRRNDPEAREPDKHTFRWLSTLPAHVRPMELAKRYPRIVNRIALLWNEQALCNKYLGSLILDRSRPDRAGFSAPIAKEIYHLHEYYVEQVCQWRFNEKEVFGFTVR